MSKNYVEIHGVHHVAYRCRDAEQTIKKHRPVMYIEMHDTQAFTLMKEWGYMILCSHGMNRLYKSIK